MKAWLSRLIKTAIVSTVAVSGHGVAASSGPLDWLETRVEEATAVDLRMDKARIAFKGCRQTQYVLSLVRELADNWQFEANAHYGRGELDYGALSQQVRTQAYELIAWRAFDSVRVGFSHAAQPHHQIALTDEHVNLPTSETLGVHVDMSVGRKAHQVVRVSFLRETWRADNTLPVDWRRSRDNQLQLAYSVAF